MTRRPISDPPSRLRQRQRATGAWRIWWEPETAVRALGFDPVELDAARLTWSAREARRLNDAVDRARRGEAREAPVRGGRSMAALIHRYRRDELVGKPAKTQVSYGGELRLIEDKWGETAVSEFTKPIMHTWMRTLSTTRGASSASHLIGMCSILFSFAEIIGWRPENSNPCFRLKRAGGKKRPRVASWPEIDALLDAADALELPQVGAAVRLALFQGQRQTDVLGARLHQFRQITILQVPGDAASQATVWIWELTRSKRATDGVMQLHPEVAPLVEARKAAAGPEDPVLVDPVTGGAFTEDAFQRRWRKVRARAAEAVPTLASLQFRDLRRTFGVFARAGGISKDDVGDVLGNSAGSDPQLGEIYMPASFATASRAVLAIRRPSRTEEKSA